ncbi:unnamed protein product [Oncorhynchus mykiss]|uniref:Protein CUSTOS n=1 Tax=Oncorhynchus mykiss TaxID=8022 RepID=A0A060WM00_ONCMY|nr:unnamed protein product [Oncorhynchus mykiss]
MRHFCINCHWYKSIFLQNDSNVLTVTTIALDGVSNVKQSRRVAVSKHEHDGKELQTTPEFRAHVANKLGALLDRFGRFPAVHHICPRRVYH